MKKCGEWIIKITISALCFYFIYEHMDAGTLANGTIPQNISTNLGIAVVFGLSFVNWALEAERWKISLPDERLSFNQALQGVLSGLAMNWVVPFTLGDVGGRLAPLKDKKRSALALLLNRSVMLLFTGVYGGTAVLYYFDMLNGWTLLLLTSSGAVFIIFILKSKATFQSTFGEVTKIILLSVARYAIFTIQFYLLIRLSLPTIPPLLICLGIGWVFLFRSLIPSLFGNFGVREASALFFFNSFLSNPELILIPCFLIWVINTVLPSVVGALFLLKLRVNIAQ